MLKLGVLFPKTFASIAVLSSLLILEIVIDPDKSLDTVLISVVICVVTICVVVVSVLGVVVSVLGVVVSVLCVIVSVLCVIVGTPV